MRVSVGLLRIDSDSVLDARGNGRHGGPSGIGDDEDVGDSFEGRFLLRRPTPDRL